ncbi:MAG TPA: DUF456 domain-containing protein [Anaerolineae bacterium]|nr:DUF456 domain-containing protein [Anaerolineae bacterium]
MPPSPTHLLQILAYVGLVVGVIGVVLPIIPGPVLIWLSALLWAWGDRFQAVGWPTLLILAVLALLAELSDVALAAMGAKRGGASWFSMVVAGTVALIGFIFFNLIGALAGALLGMLAWESYRQGWEVRKAWKASGGFILGYLAAIAVKMFFALIMIIIFVWQAFYT